MKRNLFLVTMALLLVVTLAFASVGAINAETQATATLVASEDTYIDRGFPDQNNDGGALFLSYGVNPDQIVLLKFDLSGVGFTIDKARLNLDSVNDPAGCSLSSDAVPEINIYETSSTWSQGTVTFNSAPTQGAFLDDMEQAALVPGDHVYWEDAGGESLAAYLETQRGGSASIWMELPSGTGNQVLFEDTEGTAAFVGCAGTDLVPTLQLSDSTDPLAVSNLDSSASNGGISPFVWVAAVAVIVVISGLALASRRRTEVS